MEALGLLAPIVATLAFGGALLLPSKPKPQPVRHDFFEDIVPKDGDFHTRLSAALAALEAPTDVTPAPPELSDVGTIERAVPLTRLPLRPRTCTEGASDASLTLERGSDEERARALEALIERNCTEALFAALHDRVDAIAARAAYCLVGSTSRKDYVAALAPVLPAARLEAVLDLLAGVLE